VSRYTVYVIPSAWPKIKELPGHIRHRVKRAIDSLADNPRPSKSKALAVPEFESEVRRLRVDQWRIVYTITEADNIVDVLTVRKRPPYDYGDLEKLLGEVYG
jgi:mRNA interferase RelE/StbE